MTFLWGFGFGFSYSRRKPRMAIWWSVCKKLNLEDKELYKIVNKKYINYLLREDFGLIQKLIFPWLNKR